MTSSLSDVDSSSLKFLTSDALARTIHKCSRRILEICFDTFARARFYRPFSRSREPSKQTNTGKKHDVNDNICIFSLKLQEAALESDQICDKVLRSSKHKLREAEQEGFLTARRVCKGLACCRSD